MKGKRRTFSNNDLLLFKEGMQRLHDLPQKDRMERVGDNLSSTMKEYMPVIQEAKEKGYTTKEIIQILGEVGFVITEATFKSYLSRIKTAKRKQDEEEAAKQKDVKGKKRVRKEKEEKKQEPAQPEAVEGGKTIEAAVEGNESKAAVDLPHTAEAGKTKRNIDKEPKPGTKFTKDIPDDEL